MKPDLSRYDLTDAPGRIAFLADVNGGHRYLEIGVRAGDTFFHVNMPFKIAVDPCFLFNPEEYPANGVYYLPVTSDVFFQKLRDEDGDCAPLFAACKGKPVFDIIFIDGLHTHEQSLRDFENSLEFAHDDTLWLLDDTVPCDAYSAIPNFRVSLYKRKRAGLTGTPWHGDVFKTVFAIHDKYPEFSYCTLLSGNPQTVVWKAAVSERKKFFSAPSAPANATYETLLHNAALLMPVDDGMLPCYIGTTLTPLDDAPAEAVARLSRALPSDCEHASTSLTVFDMARLACEPYGALCKHALKKLHEEGFAAFAKALYRYVAKRGQGS